MGLVFRRRGQITLEFMLVFSIMLIMLLYSVKNIGFNQDSPSTGALAVQIALEEKSVANVIAGAIDQVYAQGPGSKVTVYAHLNLLRNAQYLKNAFNLTVPQVQILLIGSNNSLFPIGAKNSIVAVAVIENGTVPVLTGTNRTGVWVQTYYPLNSAGAFNVTLNPGDLPSTLRIVVEWNPEFPVVMSYNSTDSSLYINIKLGG